MKRIYQFISKNHVLIVPLLLFFILTAGILVFNLIIVDYIDGFKVIVNNQEIAIIKSRNDVATRLSFLKRQIETEKKIDIIFEDNLIRYEPTEATLDRFTSVAKLDDNLKQNVTYKCKVWTLRINGVDTVFLRTKPEIEGLIDRLNRYFIPKARSDEKIEDLSVRILEDLSIEQGLSYFEAIKNTADAFRYLLLGVNEVQTYAVQPGDTFYFIASKYKIDFKILADANRHLNPWNLKVGDLVTLTVPKPLVNVEVRYRHIYNQIILPPVITTMDNTKLRTFLGVDAEGEQGSKRVYADKTYINENEKSVTIAREEILKEPIIRILRIGTQRTSDDVLASQAFLPPGIGIISQFFGEPRWGGRGGYHLGIDIAVSENTPVHAYKAGTVSYASWSPAGYGNLVILEHDDKTVTYYGHNNQILVNVGQRVAGGEVISLSGNTGLSTGPHVHFEVHVNNQVVDPLVYLKTQ